MKTTLNNNIIHSFIYIYNELYFVKFDGQKKYKKCEFLQE